MEILKASHIFLFDNLDILLLKRSQTDEWMPGKWCLPGGKVDSGETPLQAVIRETKEETNLIISSPILFDIDEGKYHYFYCKYFKGDIKLSFEHDDFCWVNIYNIPKSLSLVPPLENTIKSVIYDKKII